RPSDLNRHGLAVQLPHARPAEQVEVAPIPDVPVPADGERRGDRGDPRHAAAEDGQAPGRVDGDPVNTMRSGFSAAMGRGRRPSRWTFGSEWRSEMWTIRIGREPRGSFGLGMRTRVTRGQ